MSDALVSIITPTYNHERFIGVCVESVLSQTYSHWEQIILDDGSTDKTAEMIRSYSDTRIRFLSQPNQGIEQLAKTYNRALAEARGEIIAILEGDDLWPPEKLFRMVPVFADPDIVLAHGDALDIDAQGHPGKRPTRTVRSRSKLPRPLLFNDPVGSSTAYLLSQLGQSFLPPSTVLLRRAALKKIGGFQYVPGQCSPDIPTFVRMSVEGKFHYIPAVLGLRRRHLGSATLQNLGVMPLAARNYALRACKDPTLRLQPQDQENVIKSWGAYASRCDFAGGRMSLIHGEWQKARNQFASSLKSFDARIMIGASVGWALSWLHFDLEGIFRLAGRTSLRREGA